LDEIMVWGQASEADKRSVWQQLRQRHLSAAFPEAQRNLHIQLSVEAP
jgi:predicted Fe-S protein YdhL (DUF1289 family)